MCCAVSISIKERSKWVTKYLNNSVKETQNKEE